MIRNLLFDLGGVIMDLKKDNCVEAFRELGLKDPSAFFGDYGQKGPFGQLEQGLITVQQFHDHIRGLLPVPVTDEQIDAAFNKFLLGIPRHRLLQLQQLRHNYDIYLLSNTNAIMWDSKIAEAFRQDGLEIEGYFDGIVTSFEAKALKPSPEIFEYTIKHLGIDPKETIFLDDSKANLEASEAFGFRTAHVPDGQEFIDVLRSMGITK